MIMNSYEEYLEEQLELKDKEIKIYKDFIEYELKNMIKEEVKSNKFFNGNGFDEVFYKVITIPQSQYIIQLG